jgi:DNA-binding transcriptional MerR regulator
VVYFAVETVADTSVEIPNRAAFKASEVCEIAQIPPYVLRSWEKEFPRLGAASRPGGPRIYNRSDVEQILHIKQLVFAEGLTLAGARRRVEGDGPAEAEPLLALPVPDDVRVKGAEAKRGLRSLLEMLSQPAAAMPAEAASQREQRAASEEPGDRLPLLDGVPDSPPKARRPRRAAKGGREGGASNVE